MKRIPLLLVVSILAVAGSRSASADLGLLSQFNPSGAAGLCGVGVDPTTGNVWVYGCSAADVQRYSSAGTFLSSVTSPGESANDVDVEFAPEGLTLGSTFIPKGTLLFVNGETGVAEIYALDKTSGAILETLVTAFGASHVVGGAYHPGRNSFFLVQDRVAAVADRNRVSEIDPVTGAVLTTFQTTGTYDVNFGDIEVCASTGNIILVSSAESTLAEFTPDGTLVQELILPDGVSGLSGVALDGAPGEARVANTAGVVFRLGGVPCGAASPIPALPGFVTTALASLLLAGALTCMARRARRRESAPS